MSNEGRLKLLIQNRVTLKNHVKNFDDFLERYNAQTDFGELQMRMQNINRVFSNFDNINDEIAILQPDIDHSIERDNIQEEFFKITSKAFDLISTHAMPQIAQQFASSHTNANELNQSFSSNSNTLTTQRRKIKLPQTSLPSFSGKYEEWISFKNAFSTLIHENDELTNIEKLQYLRSALKDEALRKINVLPINDANYAKAWTLLERSYEDVRMLISRHLSLLLHLPSQEKENARGLMTLADDSQQHMQMLSTMGLNISPEIVVQIIEDRLHRSTLEKWEETLKRGEYPKLEDLIDFLYRTAGRLSKRKSETDKNNESNNKNHPTKQLRIQAKGHAFISKTKKCPHCEESHFVWRCEKFLALNVPERIKVIKNAKLCFNCLNSHLGKKCKFGTCPKCTKRHNSLLHPETETDKTNTNTA